MQKPGPSEQSTEANMDLHEFLRLLMRQKWVIGGIVLVVFAATLLVTLSLPKVYEAETTLEYDPSPSRPLGSGVEDVAAPVPAGNYWLAKEWYKSQNEIVTSRAISLRVVEKLGLHRNPSFFEIPEKERGTWPGATQEQAAKLLRSRVAVRQGKDTRVVRVAVSDTSPERAALLANAVADAYLSWMMEERLGSSIKAVEWLSTQLDDVSSRLRESELLLHDFRKENNVLSVSVADQQNVVTQSIHSFSAALTAAMTNRIQLSARLRQLEAALDMDPLQALVNLAPRQPVLGQLHYRYQEAIVERDRAATVYGPNHPTLIQLQTRVDLLKDEARKEVEAFITSSRRELLEAEDIEKGLQAAKQQAQRAGLELNLHEIEFNRLERERANNEKVHGLLLQRTAEANLSRMLRVLPVRLIDRALRPDIPIQPRVAMNLAAGCLLGIFLGFGVAFVRSRMDRSIASPDDVTALGLHMLGVVPEIGIERPVYGARSKSTRPSSKGKRKKDRVTQKELIVHTDPQSAVAECCRTIRTNLAFMSADKPLRSLLLTSPAPSEGKSTVAASLAISLANGGRRVLLVDTDLRRPRLHRAFSVSSTVGLSSVLAGQATLEEAIQNTVVDDLFLLPCGPIPPNPAELLHTAKFAALLEELKQRFDLLLFDSPPVNVVTDAAVLGPQLDAAVLVAKGGATSRDALKHAFLRLRGIGTTVLGCIINDLDLSSHSTYGGYPYYQGYRYADESDPNDANPPQDGHSTGEPVSGRVA